MTALASVLQALADPTRRAVFERLRRAPASVAEIAALLPVSRPAVSQHLRVLREAGLVTEEKLGARRIYRLERTGLAELRAYVNRCCDETQGDDRDRASSDR